MFSFFPATARAQTSGEIDAFLFSFSPPSPSLPFSSCGWSADQCSPNPIAVIQDGLSETDAGGGSSSSSQHDDSWHTWLRKVDSVRANQRHFVSPIVTTHVLLVEH